MFKKLKEKITEEVKSSPQRFAEFTQTVTDRLQSNSAPDDSFFTIGDEDSHNTSDTNVAQTTSDSQGFSSVTLISPSSHNSIPRRNSNVSISSDMSFLQRYESGNTYHLQSDLDVSASELEDNVSTSSSTIGHLSKEQIYSAFQKAQLRYHKYRGRYTDLARHYKELERENTKMKSVLVDTQDKAIRRVTELKEQCNLEQKAKAHLEGALRDEIDEKDYKINTLQTKIELLQNDNKPEQSDDPKSEKLESLTRYLNDARKEIEFLNVKNQELKANSIVFQSKEQEYKNKISNLEKEIAVFSEREKENNLKLAENKMELHNELLSKDTEISTLKRENEMLKQNLTALEAETKGSSKLENLQSQNKKLIEKLETLTQRSSHLENELLKTESYKYEIENLNAKLQDISSENSNLKVQNSALLIENEELQQSINENTNKQELLAKEKENLEKQITNIREEAKKGLISLEPKIRETLQKTYTEKEEELKRAFADRIEELTYSNNDLKDLQLDLFVKEDLIKKLKEELEKVKSDLSKKISDYNNLEKNHLDLIEDSTQLRGIISNFKKDKVIFDNSADRISRLEAHINTLKEELNQASDISDEKEAENVALSQENLQLQQTLREVEKQLKLLQEKSITLDVESTETKLCELKLSKLQEENKVLLPEIEMERNIMYKESLENHQEVQQKEQEISTLKTSLKEHQDEIERLKQLLHESHDKKIVLEKTNLALEQRITKLEETIRIFEEKDEAIDLDKTEYGMLLLKVQKLEEENKTLLDSFELERNNFAKELVSIKYDLSKSQESQDSEVNPDLNLIIKHIKELNELKEKELVNLSMENCNLQKELKETCEKLKLLEEKLETFGIEKSECGLLELKLKSLEEEKQGLINEFEMERRMYNGLLENNKQLQEREALIEQLDSRLTELQEELHKVTRLLKEETDQSIRLQDEKSKLEKTVVQLEEKIRIFEEKDEAINMDTTECALLEMKLQKLEEEKVNILQSFEMERVDFNKFYKRNAKNEEKIELLTEENRQLTELKLEIEGQIKELTEKLQSLSEENTQVKNSLKEAENRIQTLLDSNNNYQEEVLMKNEQIDELASKTSNLSETIKKQTIEFNNLLERAKKLDRVLESSQKQNSESLKKENLKQTEILNELETLRKEMESKNTQILEMSQKLNQIEEKYLQERDVCKEKSQEVNELHKRIVELEQEGNARLEEIGSKNKQIVEITEKLHEIEKQYLQEQNICKCKSQEIEELNKRIVKLEQEELDSKNNQIVEMNEKLIQLETQYLQEQNVCKDKSREIEELQKKIVELRQENEDRLEQSSRAQEEKSYLQTKLKQLETQLKDKNVQIETVKQDNTLLREQSNALYNDVKNLRVEIDHLNAELNTLRAISAQSQESSKKFSQLLVENQTLKEQIETTQGEIAELNNRVQQMTVDNRNLMEEYQSVLNEKEELKLRLEALEGDHMKEKLLEQIQTLTNTLEEVRGQLNDAQEQNIELLKEKSIVSTNETDIIKIQQDFYDIKEKCDSLFVENKNLKVEYTKLEEKCNDFGKIKQKLETQIRDLEEQYTEIMHEKQLLQDEVQELKISPLNYTQNNHKLDQLNILKDEQVNEPYLKEIEELRDKLSKYKSLDITNKSSIEFYEHELDKLKNQNDKLNRKLDETLVTLNHCAELSTSSTEVEYLKNVLYNYMLGKESMILARVIAAVCKFDPEQTEIVLQREQQKQTLLGQLGFI